MKAKQCSYDGCDYIGPLWQSIPRLCKTHALMLKAENAPKPTKVYSTLNPVSEKQVKRLAEYRKVRDKWLKENPFCEVCGTTDNISIHHKAGKIGDLLTDSRYFLTVCLTHHRIIEENVNWAKSKGYSLDRLDKSA